MRKILLMVNILVGVTSQTGIDLKTKTSSKQSVSYINDNK